MDAMAIVDVLHVYGLMYRLWEFYSAVNFVSFVVETDDVMLCFLVWTAKGLEYEYKAVNLCKREQFSPGKESQSLPYFLFGLGSVKTEHTYIYICTYIQSSRTMV